MEARQVNDEDDWTGFLMTHEPEHHDPLSDAEEEAPLIQQLEAYGRSARDRTDLEHRLYSSSVEFLNSPHESLPFSGPSKAVVWSRLALAACILLAFAVTVQMLLNPGADQSSAGLQGPSMAATEPLGITDFPVDLELVTDRETVVFALLDAGETGEIQSVGDLEGTDTYGVAFAPILGTAGFELTDFAEEIQLIQGSMRR